MPRQPIPADHISGATGLTKAWHNGTGPPATFYERNLYGEYSKDAPPCYYPPMGTSMPQNALISQLAALWRTLTEAQARLWHRKALRYAVGNYMAFVITNIARHKRGLPPTAVP